MKLLRWQNMRIGHKYGVILFIVIMLFVVATAYVASFLFDIQHCIADMEIKGERAVTIAHMAYLLKAKNGVISDYISMETKSLLEEYDRYDKEFIELQNKIEPAMDTEDLKFLFNIIANNNKTMNETFKNKIIPYLEKDDEQNAIFANINISSTSKSSFSVFEKLRGKVNEGRHKSIERTNIIVGKTITTLIMCIIGVTVIGAVAVFITSKRITSNFNKVIKMSNRISEGDLTVEKIDYRGKDEIGKLSEAMNQMLDNLRSMVKEITDSSLDISQQGDTLSNIAKEVKEGSEQISATMQEMAGGVEEQANSANNIASSIGSLTELIKNANINSGILENSSKDILNVASIGNQQMKISIEKMNDINAIFRDSVTKVKRLEKNSENISKLVQVIDSISEQTNLLALNAAIEAARAGEAGKGFAVVAEEIRKLAEQVGNSVNEITNIVMGIQNETSLMTESLEKGYQYVDEGSEQIKVTAQSFKEINDQVIEMANMIKKISDNLNEITQNSNSVNTASEQIAAISEENSAGIEETVASVQQQSSSMEIINQNANSLAALADNLERIVKGFKI